MRLILLIIVTVHIIIIITWIISGDVEAVSSLTNNYEEYSKCLYPVSKRIGYIIY